MVLGLGPFNKLRLPIAQCNLMQCWFTKNYSGCPLRLSEWLHENAHELSVKYNAEVGARIFEVDGKFAVGKVVTDYHSNQVTVANSVNVKQGAYRAVDSSWHSHGKDRGLYESSNYSDNDLINVKRYNYSYMSHTNAYPGTSSLYRIQPSGLDSKCIVSSTC